MNGITGTLIGFSFLSEFMGSLLLILIGNGVVALVSLKGSKGFKAGWASVAVGWGLAVFIGAIVASYTGGHLNFAVTIGQLIQSAGGHENFFTGKEIMVLIYLAAQFSGMFVGQIIVDLVYWLQIDKESDKAAILGIHATGPAQSERTFKTYAFNLFTEIMATFVLVLAVSAAGFFAGPKGTPPAGETPPTPPALVQIALPGAIVAALVVAGVGFGLGGPTGFAINPTRDLAPRLVHAIMPIKNKGTSDWSYSWVPVVGPLIGGAAAGAMSLLFYL